MTIVTVFYSMIVPLSYLSIGGYLIIKGRSNGFARYSGTILVCMTGLFLAIGTTGLNAMRLSGIDARAIAACRIAENAGVLRRLPAAAIAAAPIAVGNLPGIRTQSAWRHGH
ncbi:MAG: hypothetical protein IPM25_19045 [Chloracidobacterium sp.]|nr:hypothetical protein [Chloracidobacterium sp.]